MLSLIDIRSIPILSPIFVISSSSHSSMMHSGQGHMRGGCSNFHEALIRDNRVSDHAIYQEIGEVDLGYCP